MKKLLYLFVILITALGAQSCSDGIKGVWTCKKVTMVGLNYDELPDYGKKLLDDQIGATLTFKGREVIDAQKKKGRVDMSKGHYHLSDDHKVLTVNFKQYSYDGGKTWKDVPEGLPADFDYLINALDDKQLIFQMEQEEGIVFEYTYEKE